MITYKGLESYNFMGVPSTRCTAPRCLNPRSRMPHPSFFDLRAGSGALFCTGLVPIAYYTLIDKGLKTVQVFRL